MSGAQTSTNASRIVEGMLRVKLDGAILSGGLAPIASGSSVKIGRENRADTTWTGKETCNACCKVEERELPVPIILSIGDTDLNLEEAYSSQNL